MNIFKLHCSAQFCVSLAYALLVVLYFFILLFLKSENMLINISIYDNHNNIKEEAYNLIDWIKQLRLIGSKI